MKVLHINQADTAGGAAIAGYRLHQQLLAQGVNSRLLVGMAKTLSDRVAAIPRQPRLESVLLRLSWHLGLNYTNIVSSFNIPHHAFYQDANILNFHNLHGGYFNYLAIPALTQKPAVITLHDMWSFTGHCAYSYDCSRWQTGCGRCPYPKTYPEIKVDRTHREWQLKDWVYRRSRLTVITPSAWLAAQARQSILQRFPIHHVPNGIDTQIFAPLNKHQCRTLLGITAERKVLMFSAHSLKDSRKGGDLLLKTLSRLPDSVKQEAVLLTLGDGGEAIAGAVGLPTINLGYVSGDRLKAIAYSAADLFIFPTRADNLPLVLQESMACGTPMVSFKLGGVPELVRPGITGYLAQPEDDQDLARGIVQLLADEALQQMSQNCRAIALAEYSLELQAQRYRELYNQTLKQFQTSADPTSS
ncbi:MAG: glycosyltransferase family 4 protein [Cyanophyceae cyanobacterium]